MGRESRLNPFARPVPVIDTTELVVLDGRGRALQIGDEVLAHQAPPLYRIQNIERATGPTFPPGMLLVTVVGSLRLVAPRNQPVQELLRIATAEELKPAPVVNLTDKE